MADERRCEEGAKRAFRSGTRLYASHDLPQAAQLDYAVSEAPVTAGLRSGAGAASRRPASNAPW
jgi:hypothetical protein